MVFQMKKLFLSRDASNECLAKLRSMGFDIVLLPPYSRLPKPTASHADMLLFRTEDGLLCYRGYYEENKAVFSSINTIFSETEAAAEYPRDIALDALCMNGIVYGKEQCVSREILSRAKSFRAVKQGYARCSVLKLGESAAVTADAGLAAALAEDGIDVLRISPGAISLPGYDFGFIGGASFSTEDSVMFFGDHMTHPDGRRIEEFAASHGFCCTALDNTQLCDIGGAVII